MAETERDPALRAALRALRAGRRPKPYVPYEKRDPRDMVQSLDPDIGPTLPPSYKKGGKVKKTGSAKLHKGERVLTAKQAKAHAKAAPRRRAPR